jgi:outer membrane protein assembly factor BamB
MCQIAAHPLKKFKKNAPLAWVGNQFYGHKGLFAGVAAGNVLACLLALGLLRWMFRTETNAVYAP